MGVDPNAIGSVVPPFGGGGGGAAVLTSALPVLWEWNRTDLDEFDTGSLLDFRQTSGLGPAGVVTPSFEADVFQGVPGIRLTADAAFVGGFVLPVSISSLELPAHFLLECRIAAISTNMVAGICPFGIADPSTASGAGWKGTVFRRDAAGTIAQHRLTTLDGPSNQQTLRTLTINDVTPSVSTWNTALEERGGESFLFECFRQAGADPTDWAWRTVVNDPANYDSGALARQNVSVFADPSPDWDGDDMTRFGIAIINDTGGGAAGVVDFLDLRVFQHPFDR